MIVEYKKKFGESWAEPHECCVVKEGYCAEHKM